MPKPISVVNPTPMRVVIVTMDSHLSGALGRARTALKRNLPNLELTTHAADLWAGSDVALEACLDDIAMGDIVIVTIISGWCCRRSGRDATPAMRWSASCRRAKS
jgi:magnesium chelatase subunit H